MDALFAATPHSPHITPDHHADLTGPAKLRLSSLAVAYALKDGHLDVAARYMVLTWRDAQPSTRRMT